MLYFFLPYAPYGTQLIPRVIPTRTTATSGTMIHTHRGITCRVVPVQLPPRCSTRSDQCQAPPTKPPPRVDVRTPSFASQRNTNKAPGKDLGPLVSLSTLAYKPHPSIRSLAPTGHPTASTPAPRPHGLTHLGKNEPPATHLSATAATTLTKFEAPSKPTTKLIHDRHAALRAYNAKYRGIKSADPAPLDGKCRTRGLVALYQALMATFHHGHKTIPAWKKALPTRSQLRRTGFGRPSQHHSFTQVASFETCIHPLFLSGYLDMYSFVSLCAITPVIPHLAKMMISLYNHDFTWLAYDDPEWKSRTTVPQSHARAILAALFHYRMHAADVMRFLGGTYTGEYRNVTGTVKILLDHGINPTLVAHYVRTTTVGCPAHFVAESSRDNFLLHWREGNHPSIKKHLGAKYVGDHGQGAPESIQCSPPVLYRTLPTTPLPYPTTCPGKVGKGPPSHLRCRTSLYGDVNPHQHDDLDALGCRARMQIWRRAPVPVRYNLGLPY